MERTDYLSRTRFERNLVRLLPNAGNDRTELDFGAQFPVRLPLPRDFGPGLIQPIQIRPDLHALAIQCRGGTGARFACRIQNDLHVTGYARQSHSRIRIDDRPLADSAGDGWLLRLARGSVFEWRVEPGQTIHEIIFFPAANWIQHAGIDPDDRSAGEWRRFGEPRIGLLVDRLFECVAAPGPECAALAMLALAWMTAALSSGAESPAATQTPPGGRLTIPADEFRKIQQARAILFAEYLNPPTTVRLAKRVSLNEFKLKRGYRTMFGRSIYADLRRYRMGLARDLLIAGESSVAAAACAVGYSNPGHFARAFQREFGVAPGQLSRRNRRVPVPVPDSTIAPDQPQPSVSPASNTAPSIGLHSHHIDTVN